MKFLFLLLFFVSNLVFAGSGEDPNLAMNKGSSESEANALVPGVNHGACVTCQNSNRRLTDGKNIAQPGKSKTDPNGSSTNAKGTR